MEIHELNTFSGTPGAGDYLATDNGTDTSKISADALFAPLNARIDNIIAGGTAPSAAEVTDARLGASVLGGVQYASLGDATRGQATTLYEDIINAEMSIGNCATKGNLKFPLINGSYYRSSDGSIGTSSTLSRTEYIPANNLKGALFKSSASARVQVLFFTKSKSLIDYSAVYSGGYTTQVFVPVPQAAAYIAFNVWDGTLAEIELVAVFGNKTVSVNPPYDGEGYLYIPNHWMNGSGTLQTTPNLDLVVVPIPNASFAFINSEASYNAICKAADGTTVLYNGSSGFTQIAPYGRLYPIPSGTAIIFFNIYKNQVDGIGNYSNYISFIRNGEGLQGKKIACIGDSITWLDGQSGGYGDSTNFVGYEAVLRKRGADVRNFGWSGYPYADLTAENVNYGIHKQIVTEGADLTDFDIAILFGGANDMLYSSPLGASSEDYSSPNLDGTTFNGAIGGIINYIRSNNANCKIFICTMLPSEAVSRSYDVNSEYRDAVIQNGKFWQVPVIDMYTLINAHPTSSQFDNYFYDVTHPNARGMARIGEIIANFVETH